MSHIVFDPPPPPGDSVRPRRLRTGDRVAVISPGRWIAAEELERAVERFEQIGLRAYIHPQNFLRENQFAGNAEQRAAALHEMFADSAICAVVLAKAGYGALHLLDLLDYGLIARNPKAFVGYSDATALLVAMHAKTGLVTFHGPMLYDLRDAFDGLTWRWFKDTLIEAKTPAIDTQSAPDVKVLRSGVGVGRVIGGNLTLLANLIGTSTDFDSVGQILFLEDCDEKLYSIDRLLLHLKRTGRLDQLSGLLIGEMRNILDDPVPFGHSVDDLVMSYCGGTTFPIISNCPIGHGMHNMTLPIGVTATLSADLSSFTFEIAEPAVL